MAEHTCPWKVRQWPDCDAVAETSSFTVKVSGLEQSISRFCMDYVKIMESFRSKMEEDSSAIITPHDSVSLCLLLWQSHIFFHPFFFHKHTNVHALLTYSSKFLIFFPISDVTAWNRTCIESSLQLGFLFSCWGTALHIKIRRKCVNALAILPGSKHTHFVLSDTQGHFPFPTL